MNHQALKERHRAERDASIPTSGAARIETMMDNPGTLWGDACYPVMK